MRLVALFLASAVVLSPFQPALSARAQSGSPPRVVTAHVSSPTYTVDDSGVHVPGSQVNDRPGAPALPVWTRVVELPSEGQWRIVVRTPGARELEHLAAIPAVPAPELAPPPNGWAAETDLPGAVPTADRPDRAIYGADAFYPSSAVVPGAVQWRQGRRLLPVQIFPFTYNPVSRKLRYHPDVEFAIEITPGAPAAGSGTDAPAGVANPAASAEGALRIRTGARGLYRLTYDDLLAAGLPLTAVDPASFAMSYLGQPVAIELVDDGDANFEPGELVIFYAEPYQGRYESTNVYWFTYGGAAGLRMAGRTVTPTGGEPVVTTITRTLQVEVNAEYRSDYPRPQDADHWFDTPLSPDDLAGTSTLTRTYTLPLVDPLPGGVARIQAALHGGADRPANPDKSIAITLNSHPLAVHQWEGTTYYVSDDSVPSDWLGVATNRIHLTASTAQLPGIEFYSVSPDWVKVTYPALARAQGDRLYVEAMAEGAVEVATSGWTTPDVRVYDLRDPNQPVRVLTTAAEPAGGGYTVSFWDEALPGPTYALSSLSALSAPVAIEADLPSSWRTSGHQADYIAIVHRSLWSAIDPLLAHRAAEGLAVAKVDVQDIYDEWSYGRRDPEAIRGFLTYAYRCWNGGPCAAPPAQPPNPPRYVLLVGDGHYDFTGASGTSYPNLIPPYLVHIDPWLGETAADNRFVSFDGPGDYLAEMAIGRIPARTPADVAAAIGKIIAYETTAPAGDWQRRLVFVADNHLDPAGDFHAYSDQVRLNWLPAPYDDRMIYYNRDYFSGGAMRTAIKAAFDADALMIQWFGHGSKFRWGSVSMFNTFDPPALAANDTWPFSVTYACWTGYFINLFVSNTGQSLAETLLLTPQRGSVADLSPSGLHVGDALLTLNQGLVDAVFRRRIERAGDAVDAARLYYFGHAGSFHDVIDTSIYFGDPALKLRLPPIDLSASTMAVSPSQAEPGATLHYTVTLQNTAIFTATDVTVAVDYADAYGRVTASPPAAVDASGVLTFTLPTVAPGAQVLTFTLGLDPVLPAGVTAIHAPAAVRSWGSALADLDAVSLVSAAPDLVASTMAVSRAWAPPAHPLTYTVTLSNTGNAPSASTALTVTLPAGLVDIVSSDLVYDAQAHRLTWLGAVPAAAPGVTLAFAGAVSSVEGACGQLDVAAIVRDELGQETSLATSTFLAVPDVDCDGDVDIVDIQLVTARWGAARGDPLYHPRYDLDGDEQIGVLDLVIAAQAW